MAAPAGHTSATPNTDTAPALRSSSKSMDVLQRTESESMGQSSAPGPNGPWCHCSGRHQETSAAPRARLPQSGAACTRGRGGNNTYTSCVPAPADQAAGRERSELSTRWRSALSATGPHGEPELRSLSVSLSGWTSARARLAFSAGVRDSGSSGSCLPCQKWNTSSHGARLTPTHLAYGRAALCGRLGAHRGPRCAGWDLLRVQRRVERGWRKSWNPVWGGVQSGPRAAPGRARPNSAVASPSCAPRTVCGDGLPLPVSLEGALLGEAEAVGLARLGQVLRLPRKSTRSA